jgi:flagellar hook-associated protein 2
VVLGVRQRLQSFISMNVNTTGAIRNLRDLGIQLQKDGSIKLDSTVLTAALAKDPEAVNRIFSKTTTGLGDTISAYVKGQNDSVTGALVARRNGLDAITKSLTKKTEKLNIHLEAYRRQLNIQFQALENIMSGVNNTVKFLDAQDARLRASIK